MLINSPLCVLEMYDVCAVLISDFLPPLSFLSISLSLTLLNQTLLKVNHPLCVVFIPPPLVTVIQIHVHADKLLKGGVRTQSPIANKGLMSTAHVTSLKHPLSLFSLQCTLTNVLT